MIQKQTVIKWMLTTLWIAIGAGTIVLLVAAIRKKDGLHCTGININIKGVNNNFFVDKKDILNAITEYVEGSVVGQPVASFNLKSIESELKKNIWVRQAQLFFDNNQVLEVNVLESEPLARVFTTTGTSFYIDSAVSMLPLSDKFSARLPVFTGFPSDRKVLAKADSILLRDVLSLSLAIQKDSFTMAMIDQVDITPTRQFELVPKIGNNIIVFGDASNPEEKLRKLRLFYSEVLVKAGWNRYSVVNLQYRGQVVAKRKGAEDVTADSLRTLQLMQLISENAARMANDSLETIVQDNEHNTTDQNLIEHSIQRDDNMIEISNTDEKPKPQDLPPYAKPLILSPSKSPAAKPAVTVPVKPAQPAAPKPMAAEQKTVTPQPVPKPVPKPVVKKEPVKKTVQPKAANDY